MASNSILISSVLLSKSELHWCNCIFVLSKVFSHSAYELNLYLLYLVGGVRVRVGVGRFLLVNLGIKLPKLLPIVLSFKKSVTSCSSALSALSACAAQW